MPNLNARLGRLEARLPRPLPEASADSLHCAFKELGLPVDEVPLPGESFTDYMHRCPQAAVFDVVRWAYHGIRP
jgi:hypothetical protein